MHSKLTHEHVYFTFPSLFLKIVFVFKETDKHAQIFIEVNEIYLTDCKTTDFNKIINRIHVKSIVIIFLDVFN